MITEVAKAIESHIIVYGFIPTLDSTSSKNLTRPAPLAGPTSLLFLLLDNLSPYTSYLSLVIKLSNSQRLDLMGWFRI